MEPSVDLDSIIGNHMNEGLYQEEEKKYQGYQSKSTDPQDGRGRRNAIVVGATATPVEDGEESFFFTGIDSNVEVGLMDVVSSKSTTEQFLKDYNVISADDTKAISSSASLNEISKLSFTENSKLDVHIQSLMNHIDYHDIVSGKFGDGHLFPGGLGMSHAVTKKYFGVQARQNFFEQLQSMQKKRQIYGTECDISTPADLSYAIALASPSKNVALEKAQEDVPFKVDRPPQVLKVNTRVIIRTQGIGLDEAYEQMKLIQKPKNLAVDEQGDTSTDSEADDAKNRESPFPLSLTVDRNVIKKGASSTKSPKEHKAKPSPSNLKLKPITTGRTQNGSSTSLPGLISTGSSGANSARSSDSARSNKKKLAPMQLEEGESESRGIKNAKQKSISKSAAPIEAKPKQRQGILHSIKEESDAQNGPTVSFLAGLYKEHLMMTKIEEEKGSATKKKLKEKGELDEDSKLPDMELVCIDHRDALNRKIIDNLHKKSSLFKYVEAKTAKKDFYDLSDHSDESDGEGEISLWSQQSPLSPSHVIPILSPISKNKRAGRAQPAMRKREIKPEDREVKPTDDITLSPRSKFIDSCIRKQLNPRASLILRKTFTKELNLKHLGMGDELAVLLADAIISIPYIQSLNICDNNLRDKGLSAIIGAVSHMSDLVELNMSMNEIGPNAAQALNNYLIKGNCPLKTLILRKADVDDDECRDFVQALEHNKNLTTLDLSENLVGSSENLNTVMPDLVTGGEALADLLSSPNCPLTSLKLGWNMIRLDGAAALCGALAVNRSLTYLELSFNSLGASGGVALGDALQENKVLKTLLLANNSLDSIACLTICAGILENEALQDISFDGNPIGEQGAKVLMLLPTIVGSRVSISAKNCNISMRDPRNWFDTGALVRKFELDLSQPFERAIAIILLYLIPSHQTYIAPFSEYLEPDSKQWIDLKLKETVDKEYFSSRPLDPEQLQLIGRLKRVLEATRDISKARELFEEMDEDGSGELDEHEFGKLMESIGMDASQSKVQEVLAEYDVDGGGVIEMAEFLLFLKNQRKEAKKRLKELTEFPILASEHFNPSVRYIPPKNGLFRITIIDGFTQKETYRVISPGDRVNILKVAEQSGELLQMTSFGMKNYKVRLDEALVLSHQLMKETNNKVRVLATLLPQMSTSLDARTLVNKLLGQNLLELSRLKREIGQSYRVLMGQPDGFYTLDLSNEMDRFCINRLLEISMTTQHYRSVKRSCLGYGKLGDTSQKGNFSCFRNELLNKKPVTITVEFASPLPRTGKLEFDFVSQRRFKADNFALNDIRFTNLLVKMFLLNPLERPKVITHLRMIRKHCDRALGGDGKTIYEMPKDKSFEIGNAMATFYDKLPERIEQYEKYRSKESVKSTWEYDANVLQLNMNTAKFVYQVPFLYKTSVEKFSISSDSADKTSTKNDSSLTSTSLSTLSSKNNVSPINTESNSEQEELSSNPKIGETTDTESHEIREVDRNQAVEVDKSLKEPPSHKHDVISSFEQAEEEIGEALDGVDEDMMDETDGDFALAERPAVETRNSKISNIKQPENNPTSSNRLSDRQVSTSMKGNRSSFFSAYSDKSKGDKKDLSTGQDQTGSTQEVLRLIQNEEAKYSTSTTTEFEESPMSTKKPKPLNEVLNKYVCLMGSKNVPAYAKAAKTLEIIVDQFETQFIYSRHLEIIVLLFQDYGSLKNSDDFGTYRVDLVVQLFSCIIDLHNIEIVFRQLTAFEIACIRCRLGYLNLFNPMKPEGSFEFDLSRREERQIVKMLAQLSVAEPGDNLPFVQFRWERDMDPMPGYELTEPWLTEEGLPSRGLWNVTYYSGEGKGKKGCKAVVKLRKSMLQLVLVEEEEVITETDRDQERVVHAVGPGFIKSNPGIWWSYLAYDEVEHKAIKDKSGGSGSSDKKRK